MTPADIILSKALVASNLDTEGWSEIQASLRNRAFFSAKIEEERFLGEARTACAQLADGSLSKSEARMKLRAVVAKTKMPTGVGQEEEKSDSSLRHPLSKARLNLILDHNRQSAQNYARFKKETTPGALASYPAQELVRTRRVKVPRNWALIWDEKWTKLHPGEQNPRLTTGKMMALKVDPIWSAISRFGNPWPPFDFNSGMTLRNVSQSKALEAGILKDEKTTLEKLQKEADQCSMNDTMKASLKVDDLPDNGRSLKETFGDQIQLQQGKVEWRSHAIVRNFEKSINDPNSRGRFKMDAGESSSYIRGIFGKKKSLGIDPKMIEGKSLEVTQQWLDKKRSVKTEAEPGDHRKHFEPIPERPLSRPLEKKDIELIPSIWRRPDILTKSEYGNGAYVFEVQSFEGDFYRMIVKFKDSDKSEHYLEKPKLLTFYRSPISYPTEMKRKKNKERQSVDASNTP